MQGTRLGVGNAAARSFPSCPPRTTRSVPRGFRSASCRLGREPCGASGKRAATLHGGCKGEQLVMHRAGASEVMTKKMAPVFEASFVSCLLSCFSLVATALLARNHAAIVTLNG